MGAAGDINGIVKDRGCGCVSLIALYRAVVISGDRSQLAGYHIKIGTGAGKFIQEKQNLFS